MLQISIFSQRIKVQFVLLSFLFISQMVFSQVGIGVPPGETPEATLDVRFDSSVAPGFLMPRVNNLPEATIENPITEGMLVYYAGNDPSLVNSYYVYVDGEWKTLAETSGIDTQGPTAPGSLTASNPTSSTIDLTWVASSDNFGVEGYKIYDDSDDSLVATVTGSTSTTISGLSSNTSYTFYATAYDAAGNESDPSNTATETTEVTAVTINEGYFETGNDGWLEFDRGERDETVNSCEQSYSMEIKHNKDDSKIELQNVDLSTYTYVTVNFEYKTTNWNGNGSSDYFTFKLNGSELGSFYESGSCTSVSIVIPGSVYSFGSSDTFKFEGEMSGGNEKVYIDAIVIKGYD